MFNNIPLSEQEGMYIFPGGSGTTTWIQWTKPPGIKFVYTMCVGGGAGVHHRQISLPISTR